MNLISCLAVSTILGLVMIGCSDESKDALPPAQAQKPASVGVSAPAPATTPAPSNPVANTGNAEAVDPQLAPIQNAVQAFEKQNNRPPVNVEEMVKAGVLKEMPTPPAGKLYYIDQTTKKVRYGSNP